MNNEKFTTISQCLILQIPFDLWPRILDAAKANKCTMEKYVIGAVRASLPPIPAPACTTCGKPRNECDHFFHGDNR